MVSSVATPSLMTGIGSVTSPALFTSAHSVIQRNISKQSARGSSGINSSAQNIYKKASAKVEAFLLGTL
jgi:hypothetical protein